jgi:ribosomal protein S30
MGIHGGIARAGKVRVNTPKVEPQDGNKKKTGLVVLSALVI